VRLWLLDKSWALESVKVGLSPLWCRPFKRTVRRSSGTAGISYEGRRPIDALVDARYLSPPKCSYFRVVCRPDRGRGPPRYCYAD
jgi:hypothetical protein